MTNVIVDAGTDAKIAKFQRRGLVLIDLASLEPVEVWGDHPSCAAKAGVNTTGDDSQSMHSRIPTTLSIPASSRGHTPEYHLTPLPSITSFDPAKQSQSENLQQSYPEPQPQQNLLFPPSSSDDPDVTPLATPQLPTSPAPKRNFFGKLFQGNPNKKLKNSLSRSAAPLPSPSMDRPPPPQTKPNSRVSDRPLSSVSLPPKSGDNLRITENVQAKNISLTTFTVPMKATLKNKNRLSVTNTNSSSSLNPASDIQSMEPGISQTRNVNRADPSPHMSASSLTATTASVESEKVVHGNQLLPGAFHQNPLPQSASQSHVALAHPCAPQTQLQKLQSRPPVLGIQPTFVSALGSNLSGTCDKKKMRALMYVWLVRRWLKQPTHDDTSSSHGVTGRGGFLGLGSGSKGDDHSGNTVEPGSDVEVRFEWKRGKVKASSRGMRKARSEVGDRRSNSTANEDHGVSEETKRKRSVKRASSQSGSGKSSRSIGSGVGSEEGNEESRKRRMRRPSSSHYSSEGMGEGDWRDDGEDSDPEDSETPWVCTLKVRRTTASFAKSDRLGLKQSSRSREKVLKLKVATLSPTPHHPKVVAMLKVPFPLPDIEVERLCIRRRTREFIPEQGDVNEMGEMEQPGSASRDAFNTNYRGLELAAEEIKDIICSTALWLIVREGTAGVGRVSRKGDGWKLRS